MLSIARGAAWVGAIIVWWSLNVVWGNDPDSGNGPPGQWERHVVGAGLLAFIAALSLSVSGGKGKPPSWIARGITLACAVGIGAIALYLRSDALRDFPHLIAGPGWSWLLSGGGFLLSAATLSFGLKPAEKSRKKPGSQPAPGASPASSSGKSPSRPSKKRRKKRKR